MKEHAMKLNAVHHIAIIVSSYGQSRAFYVDKLGFDIVRENYRPEKKDWKLDLRVNKAILPEAFGIPKTR